MNNPDYHYIYRKSYKTPVVLFLHGFMGSAHDWLPIMEEIKDRYSSIALDLPGHGKTTTENHYWERCNIRNIAESICSFLYMLNIQKVYLYGYSMGGRLAMYLSVFHPRRFKGVIIESASPGIKENRERKIRMQHDSNISKLLISMNYKDFLNLWYKQPIFSNLNQRADFDSLIKSMEKNNPSQLACALKCLSVARQPELWSHLKEIKIPMHLLTGEKDIKFTSIANKITKINPSITHKTIKGSGHKIHFEAPMEIVNAIYTFFPAEK